MQTSYPNPRVSPLPPLENSYLQLPEVCYARVAPTPVSRPRLLRLNTALAEQLGLDPRALAAPDAVEVLAGNRVPEGAQPVALAYAGHQFGNWVPQLGDGRAVLLGEILDRHGVRRDVQLKGSGRTPFSRGGDGRAALGPVVREYLVSEGMAGLGIPSTRALAMLASGDPVIRERVAPGGVLVRVAASHVRIGSFEYLSARREHAALRALADYVIARHYPALADSGQPYRDLIEAVAIRTADLVAEWMRVGFIHGVMNTDNMSIAGETLDYGPCAFMDSYHRDTVFSSIDVHGRYAYGRQPTLAHWNLARLAEALLPLLDADPDAAVASALGALEAYGTRFEASYRAAFNRKLGLRELRDDDDGLARDLLEKMGEQGADFTLAFRRLSALSGTPDARDAQVRELFAAPAAFDAWLARWRERLAAEGSEDAARHATMRGANPAYIPRNHRVEQAIAAVVEHDDLAPLEDLLTVLSRPYEDHPEFVHLAAPPQPDEVVRQTFCGT